MKLINQSFEILAVAPFATELMEKAGRVCYQSEHKVGPDTAVPFLQQKIKTGHTSVLEHGNITVKIITNRGVSKNKKAQTERTFKILCQLTES